MAGPPLQLHATPDVAAHVVAALRRHRQLLAREGAPLPAGLDVVEAAFAARADLADVAAGGRSPRPAVHHAPVPELLTTDEAVARLGCSTRSVRRRCAAGELPAEQHDGRWLVPAATLPADT